MKISRFCSSAAHKGNLLMIVDGKQIRPIWMDKKSKTISIIDQRLLPHEFVIESLLTVDDTITAIKDMYVRGAPLIGVTGAFGVYLAALNLKDKALDDNCLIRECMRLKSARPTAVNLAWGVDRVMSEVLKKRNLEDKIKAALMEAEIIAEEEAENCRKIGEYGCTIIKKISREKKGKTVNILTHCNAGWLACIEYGTATAPVYTAFDNNIDVHVWVDETRPLNQGARLTAWELGKELLQKT